MAGQSPKGRRDGLRRHLRAPAVAPPRRHIGRIRRSAFTCASKRRPRERLAWPNKRKSDSRPASAPCGSVPRPIPPSRAGIGARRTPILRNSSRSVVGNSVSEIQRTRAVSYAAKQCLNLTHQGSAAGEFTNGHRHHNPVTAFKFQARGQPIGSCHGTPPSSRKPCNTPALEVCCVR